ncbi:uncharacterized protein LOC132194321 isoform X2 [Neocloeon triangulifer]|uniref:uncharacterized protein LOC132194321 isoform X2 n=1 Tax=Neocloeon triangulifer TaxID=2078957 RepID=UPI00286F3C5E|nr:uncharacterized protein LOC132194321 isoform X2 [Neocloeon triangulifer]
MKVVMNCCDYIESSSAAAPYYNNLNPASPPSQQPYQPHCNNYPPYEYQQSSSYYYQQQQQQPTPPKSNMSASLGLQTQANYPSNNYYYSHHYNGYQQQHPQPQQDYYGSHFNNMHQYSSNSYNSGGYVYNPQEARIRKAQRDQTKQALRAARQRKNSGHAEREVSPPPHMMRHPCLPRNGPGMIPPFGAHPHKVFHGSATAAVSANEMRGHGGPSVHAYGASPPPPPQRFYPAPYVDQHSAYSMQYSSHHQLPAGWFGQQPQYHPQHHHQMQPNGGFGNRSLGREVPYMNSHYLPHHQQPHTPQQHQLLGPNNESDLTQMPPHLIASQYEVEGTVPPAAASTAPSTEEKKETEEKKPSSADTENPDSQPLPPFQHAFGSTEIGRFAHEGFSAQVRSGPPCEPSPPPSLPTEHPAQWLQRGPMQQQFPLTY